MEFNHFLQKIDLIKTTPLNGIESQLKMTPLERKTIDFERIVKRNPKMASVLILFYPNKENKTCILLTKRAEYKGTHSNQISFPGGKISPLDSSLQHTALRETNEEVGVELDAIQIIKKFTKTYIPPSNFWVHPFLGYLEKKPLFKTNYEVESIIELPLSSLLNNAILSTTVLETSYMKKAEVPCFKYEKYIIWGATAMILNEVKETIGKLFL